MSDQLAKQTSQNFKQYIRTKLHQTEFKACDICFKEDDPSDKKGVTWLSAASVAYGYIYTLCAKETESDAKDYTCVGCHSTT